MNKSEQNTPAGKYILSLKDPVKRRYASSYLEWVRAGRVVAAPSRGALSPTLAKVVVTNLDDLS